MTLALGTFAPFCLQVDYPPPRRGELRLFCRRTNDALVCWAITPFPATGRLQWEDTPPLLARRPSVGAVPGRCGFSLAADTHRPPSLHHVPESRLRQRAERRLLPLGGALAQCLDVGPELLPTAALRFGEPGQRLGAAHAGEVGVLLPVRHRLPHGAAR